MKTASKTCTVANQGLYNPEHEHDSCGTGFIAQVNGRRSNRILRLGLRSICNLMHRGALDADAKTGDGAGVITQIPYKLFVPEVVRLGHTLYKEGDLAVGVMFLPHDNAYAQARAKAITQEVLEKRGLFLFGWREVPINIRVLGEKAQTTMPRIEHVSLASRGAWPMTITNGASFLPVMRSRTRLRRIRLAISTSPRSPTG